MSEQKVFHRKHKGSGSISQVKEQQPAPKWNAVYPLRSLSSLFTNTNTILTPPIKTDQYCSPNPLAAVNTVSVSSSCLCLASEVPPWQFRVS